MDSSNYLLTIFLLLVIAYLIHQKMIDWAFVPSHDRSSLDELAYRQLLVQNIVASTFVYLLIVALYVVAIASNTFLFDSWMHIMLLAEQYFRG